MGSLSESSRLLAAASGVPDQTCIVFEQAGKTYPSPQGPVHALQDVNFSIVPGEVFGIIGRSGAGKSTLLRMINRLESPSSGRIQVQGTDIAALSEQELQRLRRRIGMIFQHFNLLSVKTVWENVALPLQVAGVPRAEVEERVSFLLDLVGLAAKRDAYPAKLSGGQKQRVGIARALVHEPQILLCDEATSALDPESTQSILSLLRDINRRLGLTIVLITHEMAVIREICDRVAVLEKGKVAELGEVWRIFGDPRSDATQALLRPLVHDLSAELRQGLLPLEPDSSLDPSDTVYVELHLTGESARELDPGTLSTALGGPVLWLHGGIDRIQGRPQGRIVLAGRTAHASATALQAALALVVDKALILGKRKGGLHAA